MKTKVRDLTNLKFGKLTVIEKTNKRKNNSFIWLCECDCGNYKEVSRTNLIRGHTKSCGCIGNGSTSLPEGESSFNTLYYQYGRNARIRKLTFNLNKNEFRTLTKQPCYYCGSEPNQKLKNRYGSGDYIYNGLDRLNNNLGYEVNNVVSCCGICNIGKKNMSKEEFLSWITRVYKYSIEGVENEN